LHGEMSASDPKGISRWPHQ